MFVHQAREAARRWVEENASRIPGFYGAFLHGSIHELPDDAELDPTSDVDVMVVLDGPFPPPKLGKFLFQGVLLEISYLSRDQVSSPEQVLAAHHLAGSFRSESIILDPTGQLLRLQAAVSREFPRREWVRRRCESARARILQGRIEPGGPLHDQVLAWLFPAGITTHVLLVAGLRNPTVRRRYLAVRQLLEEYGRAKFYETLLELLGCAAMSRIRVETHLETLTAAYDTAAALIRTPFPFAADISAASRPVAIDGSRALVRQGDHREAVFWIEATYSRCRKVLFEDAPPACWAPHEPGYLRLLGDLGITAAAELETRLEQVREFLPRVWEVAEGIMAANPEMKV